MTTSLILLAKEPRPGRTKTRLCPPCSPDQAASVATAALADTLDAVRSVDDARPVLVLEGERPDFVPGDVEVVPQREGSHAERIAGAFSDVGGPALLIGMDTPQVTPPLLAEGIAALARPDDAVFGAAADGGWWALGLPAPRPELVLGIPTSTDSTGARQRARLHEAGYRVHELPVLRDVDTWDDAVEVAGLVRDGRFGRAVGEIGAQV